MLHPGMLIIILGSFVYGCASPSSTVHESATMTRIDALARFIEEHHYGQPPEKQEGVRHVTYSAVYGAEWFWIPVIDPIIVSKRVRLGEKDPGMSYAIVSSVRASGNTNVATLIQIVDMENGETVFNAMAIGWDSKDGWIAGPWKVTDVEGSPMPALTVPATRSAVEPSGESISSPPLVRLKELGIEGPLSHQYRIEAPDVEQYISRYGNRGWIAGLTDERTIHEATGFPSAGSGEEQAGPPEPPWLVSDLFLWYYLKAHPEITLARFDVKADRVAATLKVLGRVLRSDAGP